MQYLAKYPNDEMRRCVCRAWNLTLRIPCLRVHALALAKQALVVNIELGGAAGRYETD